MRGRLFHQLLLVLSLQRLWVTLSQAESLGCVCQSMFHVTNEPVDHRSAFHHVSDTRASACASVWFGSVLGDTQHEKRYWTVFWARSDRSAR